MPYIRPYKALWHDGCGPKYSADSLVWTSVIVLHIRDICNKLVHGVVS